MSNVCLVAIALFAEVPLAKVSYFGRTSKYMVANIGQNKGIYATDFVVLKK